MQPQLALDFTSTSQLNKDRLKGQNQRLYEWLLKGNSIHVFHPAKLEMRIGFLNSRISDLVKAGLTIHKRIIHAADLYGNLVAVKEYSMKPFK